MKDISLDGQWEFKAFDAYATLPANKRGVTKWMKATVPGTVHTDLLRRGMIDDPFFGTNERDVQWIDTQKWIYRKKFHVPENFFLEDTIELDAQGLDTYAEIRCNGQTIGETQDMFVEHRLPLKPWLKPGANELEIVFDSPVRRAMALEAEYGALQVAIDRHRVYVRKAQYSFGWDWGPHLTTSGIWRPIRLQAYSYGRLAHPFARVLAVSDEEALVALTVDVHGTDGGPLSVHAFVGGGAVGHEYAAEVREGRAEFEIHIPEPRLWWPNEYGDQTMYSAVLSLRRDGEDLDVVETTFAVRTVKLVQEADAEGTSFIIEVNGRKIFCKGADWIPCDSFLPRVTAQTYERLLTLARNAHMNMIRVWGGGIYEGDAFYDLCDRLGLMVWQDFMFACGEYPAQEWFNAQVRDEAVKAVRRLRNHPSIVVWCGNNECEWIYCTEHPGKTPDEMTGAPIFSTLLPEVCRQEDGTRIYWRSSPWGDGFPNAETNGTHHQWSVWSAWKDYREYANDTARFVSEFGFQAPANRETLERAMNKGDRSPQSPAMEHHNKQIEGPERLFRFRAAHYGVNDSFDDFVYHGQLVQAEALKFAVEHWRRRKYLTAGTLFWQLNDCWPVSSWSVIDSALIPKAAYYYAKRFYAPVLLTFKENGDAIELWLTNDTTIPLKGNAVIELRSVKGGVKWRHAKHIDCTVDGSYAAARILLSAIGAFDPATHYLCARFERGRTIVTENRYFFVEPKHLHLPQVKVKWKLSSMPDGTMELNVHVSKLAKNVRLEVPDGAAVEFSDNYFDLDGGVSRVITIRTDKPRAWVKKHLSIRHLQ